jgi:4'-phosphopantetheinyl transferase
VKATGDGLATPLEQLIVSPPSSPPRVLRWDRDAPAVVGRLSLHALHPPRGSVATFADVGGAPAPVVEDDAGPLLRSVLAC